MVDTGIRGLKCCDATGPGTGRAGCFCDVIGIAGWTREVAAGIVGLGREWWTVGWFIFWRWTHWEAGWGTTAGLLRYGLTVEAAAQIRKLHFFQTGKIWKLAKNENSQMEYGLILKVKSCLKCTQMLTSS